MKKLIIQETANVLTVKRKRNNPSETPLKRSPGLSGDISKIMWALADLAEESGTSPVQISQWVKAALESLEEAFA